jgi:HlyD family secretion protein
MKHIFLLFLGTLFSCTDARETTYPEYKELLEAVYSSVLLEPKDAYKVNASISGFVDTVLVKLGDNLKVGEIILHISSDPILLNQQNAYLNYVLVRQTLDGEANVLEEMKLEIKTAKLKMQNDSVNSARFSSLLAEKACSKFEFDTALLGYEMSKNNFLALKKRIARKEKELKNQLAQSRNNLKSSALKTEDYTIRSSRNGKVFQLLKEPGEYVNMQEPLAIIGDKDDFVLKMLIDEVDITKVQIGQKVVVTLEAFKDKVFEARISTISPKMDERTQTFEMEAIFSNPPKKLYMGLTGEGNIVLNEKKKALVIPREYLLPGNKVETENGIVTVKTGLSNWSYVEIINGITEKTAIFKPL